MIELKGCVRKEALLSLMDAIFQASSASLFKAVEYDSIFAGTGAW
jgi:hypothetical protein